MHREWLREKLAHFQTQDPGELTNRNRILEFMRLNAACFSSSHPPVRCEESDENLGHITASAWLLSPDHQKVLLTFHRKLKRWLQLGGHSDDCPNVLETAMREAQEESGIDKVRPLSEEIFDIDIHLIPGSSNRAQHLHYDIRFLLESVETENISMSHESIDLKWVSVRDLPSYCQEESILRMHQKWIQFLKINSSKSQ